jgi:hypothetical protein
VPVVSKFAHKLKRLNEVKYYSFLGAPTGNNLIWKKHNDKIYNDISPNPFIIKSSQSDLYVWGKFSTSIWQHTVKIHTKLLFISQKRVVKHLVLRFLEIKIIQHFTLLYIKETTNYVEEKCSHIADRMVYAYGTRKKSDYYLYKLSWDLIVNQQLKTYFE